MKLNITDTTNRYIEGYENMGVETCLGKLPEIVGHSCDDVVLYNAISRMSREDSLQILELACSRVRANGKISIYDVEIKAFCRAYINQTLDRTVFSSEIVDIANCIELSEVRSALKRHGIQVETCCIQGYNYELVGVRNRIR